MRGDIENRCVSLAKYIVRTGATVRQAAGEFKKQKVLWILCQIVLVHCRTLMINFKKQHKPMQTLLKLHL